MDSHPKLEKSYWSTQAMNYIKLGCFLHTSKVNFKLSLLWSLQFAQNLSLTRPGRVEQSVGCLTQEPEVPGSYPVRPHTFVSPSPDSRRAVVSYWQKYVQEVLVNGLGDLSLPRKSVV